MHDARVGRHDGEVLEGALPPAQERVALLITLELALGIDAEGVACAEGIDLHRVVDHELGRHQRVDLRRVAAHLCDRVAHRRQIDDGGHAGEVLHQHARWRERDLLARLLLRIPAGESFDVGGAHRTRSLVAQQVLEQHLQRERQPRHVKALLQRVEAKDLVAALTYGERVLGAEAVGWHGTRGEPTRLASRAACPGALSAAAPRHTPRAAHRCSSAPATARRRSMPTRPSLSRRVTRTWPRRSSARSAAATALSRSALGRITTNSSPP